MDMDMDDLLGQNGYEDDVLEDLTNVESTFFDQGYQAGFDHGKLHGLFEGREIGREKAWEVWEEVGFYEGWAGFHVALLADKGVVEGGRGRESRALGHSKVLLELIATFPTTNPSDAATAPAGTMDTDAAASPASKQVDLPILLSSIRARYRLLCSSLNARPRLMTASVDGSANDVDSVSGGTIGTKGAVGEGVQGPIKGVDTRQLRF